MSSGNIRLPDLKPLNEGLLEPLLSLSKLFFSAALLSGSIFLFVYCASNNIPVPVSLAELPTLLVAIFGVGSFLAMSLLVLIFLPCMPRTGYMLSGFPRLFVMRRDRADGTKARWGTAQRDVYKKIRHKVEVRNTALYACCIVLPIVEMYAYFFLTHEWEPDSWYGASTLFCIVPILSGAGYGWVLSWGLTRWSRVNRVTARGEVAGEVAGLGCIAFVWIMLIHFILLSRFAQGQQSELILALLLFGAPVVLLALFYVLMVPRAFSPVTSIKGVVIVSVTLIAVTPMFPIVSPFISGAALRTLHLGGAYGAELRLTEEGKQRLPQGFLKDLPIKEPGYIPVHVLLDLGDYVYVRRPDDHGYPVAVPRGDIQDEEIIY